MPRRAKKATSAASPTPTGELVPALHLPGEVSVDAELVEQAAGFLRHLFMANHLDLARSTGEYVLATFFGGDSKTFRTRGKEHQSFQALAKRGDLGMSSSFLWRAVSFVDQLRLLPPNIATALPYSHQLALLPLKDEEVKAQLAEKALAEGWTRNDLEDEVKKARVRGAGESKAGRPELPGFVKTIHRWEKTLEEPDTALAGLEQLDTMKVGEVRRLHATVVALRQRCDELEQQLQGRLSSQPS